MSTEPVLTQHKVTVLLIDDQPMIGEAVRRMLAGEPDIVFHYNRDAAKALEHRKYDCPALIFAAPLLDDARTAVFKKRHSHARTGERVSTGAATAMMSPASRTTIRCGASARSARRSASS